MTPNRKSIIAGITCATLLTTGAVWAATMPSSNGGAGISPQSSNEASSSQKAVNSDFAKLSNDGAKAFRDVMLARVAIFDGRVDEAKKLANEADQSFAKAKTDATVFTKAEADLRPPKATNKADAQPETKSSLSDSEMKKPTAWLPVDAVVSINEDYKLNPAKTTAVADADQSMKSGDQKGEMEKLKLAGVNTDIVLGVVPVDQTISDVHQAAQLINSGKFYEGSQVLRQIQNNEHFDVADVVETPVANKSASNTSTASPGAASSPTK